MGRLETETAITPDIERVLRDELSREDRALSGVAPVLAHLLESTGRTLVNEAAVARIRGMLTHLARQILTTAQSGGATTQPDPHQVDALAESLVSESAVLSHLYALAMEVHLAERLQKRAAIDPVLPPLMQELIASEQPATAELAMKAMAAQSRFIQGQRRMDLALGELPAELFHLVVRRSVSHVRDHVASGSPTAVQILKRSYDESATRIGLLSRLVAGMGEASLAAIDLEEAGFALFATSLAMRSRVPRELAVLACHERQGARLALSLRAAGLERSQIEQQYLLLEPAQALPVGVDDLTPRDAQAILANSSARVQG